MSWIKKEIEVEVAGELEYENTNVAETNAYDIEITECRLSHSTADGSKSVSLMIGLKTEDGETVRSFLTIMGKDGNTYYMGSQQGKPVKKQHFGLSIANTLFKIKLGKEIFDCEPTDIEYERFDKKENKMVKEEGQGFPELVGAKLGACIQMIREIQGADSKEYPTIAHFFDAETGLFADEEESDKKSKLDKWLGGKKDFKVIEKEEQNKSSFGKKKNADDSAETPKKSRWGKK